MRYRKILSHLLFFGMCSASTVLASEPPPLFHSHNDYERKRPLWDALEAGVRSVEADVWSFWDGLFVSHWPFFGKSGPFESWYLGPMMDFREKHPSALWDYLWIDIKGPEDRVKRDLMQKLKGSLARVQLPRALPQVILSGRGAAKREIASQWLSEAEAPAVQLWHDMHELKAEDPPWEGERDPWRWYSLNWSDRYTWKGDGCIPEGEWSRWKSEVLQVHLKKRKVRYFHVPKSREWVRAARVAGVDLIDLDDLSLSSEGGRSVSVCARTK